MLLIYFFYFILSLWMSCVCFHLALVLCSAAQRVFDVLLWVTVNMRSCFKESWKGGIYYSWMPTPLHKYKTPTNIRQTLFFLSVFLELKHLLRFKKLHDFPVEGTLSDLATFCRLFCPQTITTHVRACTCFAKVILRSGVA